MQQIMTYWRVGSYTFHQPCKSCNLEVSREHAIQCSGEDWNLRVMYPDFVQQWQEYQNSAVLGKLLFHEFLCVKMESVYAVGTKPEKELAKAMFSELSNTAKKIRNEISGYEKTQDGRAWFHPLKKKWNQGRS